MTAEINKCLDGTFTILVWEGNDIIVSLRNLKGVEIK
jgi:hypothetical protein